MAPRVESGYEYSTRSPHFFARAMATDARARLAMPRARVRAMYRARGHARMTIARASSTLKPSDVITREELELAANARGLTLETAFIGPVFKMIARRLDDDGDVRRMSADGASSSSSSSSSAAAVLKSNDADEDVNIVATHEGFVAPPPFGILHMDSMRVYNSRINANEKVTMRSTFGIAILLGTMSLLTAHEAGCKKCELLAIDDGNEYAAKLVRYYSRLGFEVVRVVGENGLRDMPDLLVWGGVGTRMDGDVDTLLKKWGGVIRKSLAK